MRLNSLIVGLAAASLLAGAAETASAQSRSRAPSLTLSEAASAQQGAASQRRGVQWSPSGRWGLNLNMQQQSEGRETQWGDVEAGAYYRVTPALRVGAAAGLSVAEPDPARPAETDRRGQPRVRLESIFRF